jgi:myosin-5
MDKNKDTVPDEILTLLQHSTSPFLVDMLHTATEAANASAQSNRDSLSAKPGNPKPGPLKRGPVGGGTSKKPTLGAIFKLSLISLMDTIGQTNVHYIRCIKPNEAKVAWVFEPNMVLAQLRACGVLETIRISCAGYPSRWTFDDFADRYYALVNSKHWDPHFNPDLNTLCSTILEKSIQDKDKYQVGLTKIFFRAGQLAYMEKLRADCWNECTVLLQKNMRRFITRIRYVRMKELALRLQRIARKKVALHNMQLIRQNNAVVVIQAHVRGFVARQQQKRHLNFVVNLQAGRCPESETKLRIMHERSSIFHASSFQGTIIPTNLCTIPRKLCRYTDPTTCQGMVSGIMHKSCLSYPNATTITVFRAVRKKIHGERKFITKIQSSIRRRQAKKHLQQIRTEAKSASHLQQVSYKLESKVVELTQHLTQNKDEKEQLRIKAMQLEAQLQSWTDKYTKMESKAKSMELSLVEAAQIKVDYEKLQKRYDELQDSFDDSQQEIISRDQTIQQLKDQVEKHTNEVAQLKLHPARLETDDSSNEDVAELKSQIAALKTQLSQSLKSPKRQNSVNSPYPRNLSPSRVGAGRGVSPERGGSSTPAGNAALRYQSPSRANPSATDSLATTSTSKVMYVEPEQMRPMSLDHKHLRDVESEGGDPEEAVRAILLDEALLEQEILKGLIVDLKILPPNTHQLPAHQEVVFPAHNISLCVTQMWRFGYLIESERLLFTAMDTIQKHCLVRQEGRMVNTCTLKLTLFFLIGIRWGRDD